MAEENSKAAPTRYTLSAFIDEHSKLITAIGLFVALTAFSAHIDDFGVKSILPGITLLGALVLTLELFLKVPPVPERQWRLMVFELVLVGILFTVGRYWFGTFKIIWVPAFVLLTLILWLLVYCALLVFIFKKLFLAFVQRSKWKLTQKTLQVIWVSGMCLCVVLAGLGVRWTMRQLAQHQWTAPASVKALFH
ncbi:MAG: hypothetical protein LAO30_22080 [Acidobacteriia bacterium]|nr:hypothetical protein [Terriglobia bacterium]